MRKKFGLLTLSIIYTTIIYGQGIKVTGKILERGSHHSLPGVGVIIFNTNDSTEKHLSSTGIDGIFLINGLRTNTLYTMRTSYIGYAPLVKTFQTKSGELNLDTLFMEPKSQVLEEVVIEGQKTPVVQNGDTTEMSAAAYKVNVDANAQELVQKMPGITVENGVIKAHGEEIKRVLLDGKNYFGEDASMALQNLPAEVIDKIQVYSKQSDQAEFTGFDDGNTSKVLNIVTRVDRRQGENITMTAGHDYTNRYLVSGRVNAFRSNRRLTISGGTNNINQQNFSTQDLLGVMGGGGNNRNGRGGGGFIGRQSGLNKPASIGINYSDYFGKKVTISGSYFFNLQDNHTITFSESENIGNLRDSMKFPRFQNQDLNSTSKNYNHRFDMKLEYSIDSANSIIWSPRFSTQQNNSNSTNDRVKYNIIRDTILGINPNEWLEYNRPDTIYLINGINQNEGLGYNYSSDLTFRHRFQKKGRTASLGITTSGNLNNSEGEQYTRTQGLKSLRIVDEASDSKTTGYKISSNFAYTEPLSLSSNLQFSYNISLSENKTDKYSYNQVTEQLSPKYSNVYKNHYNTQSGGVTYRLKTSEKFTASAGLQYQFALMQGARVYPNKSKVDKAFENFLPNVLMNYRFSKKSNLRMFYRTSTDPPTIDQLQDVITTSGSLNFRQGNPDLKHEYTHNAALNLRVSNPEKFTNFGINVFGSYITNTVSNAIYYMTDSTEIRAGASVDTVPPGGQLIKPLNYRDEYNTRLYFNYGFLFKPIKCNFNVVGGASYNMSPSSINDILRSTDQFNFTSGLVIASNISQNIDFTVSYTGNYTISTVRNHGDLSMFSSKIKNTNSEIWNHSIAFTSNFTIWKRLILQNTVNKQINKGLGDQYNSNYMVWNASIGVKVFTNKAGQIRLTVYDLLNQNQNVSHTVNTTSITDSRTNTLQRFFMLTFTYTYRQYKKGDKSQRQSNRPEMRQRSSSEDDNFGGEKNGGRGGRGGGRR